VGWQVALVEELAGMVELQRLSNGADLARERDIDHSSLLTTSIPVNTVAEPLFSPMGLCQISSHNC
jgi:hypothetical protein